MERIAEYALIRFVPQAYRGEQINVGLIVFNELSADVRLFLQPALLHAMGVEASKLEWISSFLTDQDDPTQQVADRWERLHKFPGFVLSELGWLSYEGDDQYELRLARIKSDYIDRPTSPKLRRKTTSVVKELRNVFRSYRIMGKDAADVYEHKVVSNLPVGPAGKLHIDFVIKNGLYHATETADFRGAEDAGIAELKEAALASFTLQYAREQLGDNMTKCYLVYSASSIIESALSPALRIAEHGVDRLFNINSGEQRRDYFDIILNAAGSPGFFDRN